MVQQKIKRVAIYCRVSTKDQSCDRQEKELLEWATRSQWEIVGVFKEIASGAKDNRAERAKILHLSKIHWIDAILVSEMSRWGRSLSDLMKTLEDLAHWGVSLIALSGVQFDLSTSHGKLLASLLASFAEFERDLIRERIASGLADAKSKGKVLGRKAGYNPSDKYKQKVLSLSAKNYSQREIAQELKISKTTVNKILKTKKEGRLNRKG